jgi:chaperonin cofactor prefoldin
LEINLKKSEVVQKALEKLDDKTRIYESCGRIFALSSKDEVLNNLKNNKKEMIKELDAQNEKKKTLENSLTEKSKEYDEVSKQKVGK